MISLENIIYDIRHILKATGSESQVNSDHLADKVHNYRARFIIEQFKRTFEIDPVWLQMIKGELLTMVNSGDTPGFGEMFIATPGVTNRPTAQNSGNLPPVARKSDISFGKVTLPTVLALPGMYAIFNITPESGWRPFYYRTQERLRMMIESRDQSLEMFNYYFKIGDAYYFYRYFNPINATLVLDNPMEGYVYQTEYVQPDRIKTGESYDVIEGMISYNGQNIYAGTQFYGVAGSNAFTGKGRVKFSKRKRKMDIRDPYPVDRNMAQAIVLEILTKDFQIARQNVSDVINDSADTLELMKLSR